MTYQFHQDGAPAAPNQIFVFGSNLSGIHGAGAAWAARKFYGAEMGNPEGLQGQSYAIPTVLHQIKGPRQLSNIAEAVVRFTTFAHQHPEMSFFITRVGCGLAGHHDFQIAPMFKGAPINCDFPDTWKVYLE